LNYFIFIEIIYLVAKGAIEKSQKAPSVFLPELANKFYSTPYHNVLTFNHIRLKCIHWAKTLFGWDSGWKFYI